MPARELARRVRGGRHQNVFLASDASSYITGDEIRVMGGRIIG